LKEVVVANSAQVLVDGPSEKAPVPRQQINLSDVSLTAIVIPKLPRATGRGFTKKKWEEEKVDEKFAESTWAKKSARFQKRRQLGDFDRFKVMKLRKQVGAPFYSVNGHWSIMGLAVFCAGMRSQRALTNLPSGTLRGPQGSLQGLCEGIDGLLGLGVLI
jgi:ribosomal protein L14E/L6E/L27E